MLDLSILYCAISKCAILCRGDKYDPAHLVQVPALLPLSELCHMSEHLLHAPNSCIVETFSAGDELVKTGKEYRQKLSMAFPWGPIIVCAGTI